METTRIRHPPPLDRRQLRQRSGSRAIAASLRVPEVEFRVAGFPGVSRTNTKGGVFFEGSFLRLPAGSFNGITFNTREVFVNRIFGLVVIIVGVFCAGEEIGDSCLLARSAGFLLARLVCPPARLPACLPVGGPACLLAWLGLLRNSPSRLELLLRFLILVIFVCQCLVAVRSLGRSVSVCRGACVVRHSVSQASKIADLAAHSRGARQ